MEPLTTTLLILGTVLLCFIVLAVLCLVAKFCIKSETTQPLYTGQLPKMAYTSTSPNNITFTKLRDLRPAYQSIEAPKITWSANYVDKIRGEALFRGTVMSTDLKHNCIMAKIDYKVLPLPPAGPKHPSMRIQTRIDAVAPYTLSNNAISRQHYAETVYTAMAWIHEQIQTMEYHVHDTVIEDSMRMMGLDKDLPKFEARPSTRYTPSWDEHTHPHNHAADEHEHYHKHTDSYHHHR